VFETDRWASWREPVNSELHLLRTREGSRVGSRRLTSSPASDAHPVIGPDAPYLAWSRTRGGRYEVVAAAIHAGHGGTILGSTEVLVSAGARWAAPLAWSRDARSLVVARGSPLAPFEAILLDPATGEWNRLSGEAGLGADLSRDGGWLAVATAGSAGPGRALPAATGFLLAPWLAERSRHRPRFGSGGVLAGPTEGAPTRLVTLDLGDADGWGELTGIALEPDGTGFVIGQRRAEAGRVRERLVDVRLECMSSGSGEAS
jgi:hypothetical protein